MASGKKNYFRHSFSARNDTKLRLFRDKVGIGFYFYYFTLLELCGEESADEIPEKYEFHLSVFRQLWGISSCKVNTIVRHLHDENLIFVETCEKVVSFRIPNFAKYLGKYTNKIESNVSNKRKEKKRKEKEIKKNKNKIKSDQENKNTEKEKEIEIIDYWNSKEMTTHTKIKTNLEKVTKGIKKRGGDLDLIKQAINNYCSILNNPDCFFTYKWDLFEFLTRENADKFFYDFSPDRFVTIQKRKDFKFQVSTTEKLMQELKEANLTEEELKAMGATL